MEISSKSTTSSVEATRLAGATREGTSATTANLPARRFRSGLLVIALYWLFPVAGLACVLLAGYGATAERRYAKANGFTKEVVAGHTAGQSFVSRYNGLSGVSVQLGTYGDQARAGLTLHLKPAPGELGIATATVPASAITGENPWYTFRFPTIAQSQNRAFYFELESPDGVVGNAVALAWWQSPGAGDPYPHGSAYLDSKAQAADLAFGLHYAPSPVDAWGQLARAFSANAAPVLVLLLGLAFALPAFTFAWKRSPAVASQYGENLPGRRVLSFVLVVALAHGLLYAVLTPPWQGPDEPSHFAYAALLDRHGMDAGAVQNLDQQGKDADQELMEAVAASMNRNSFTRYLNGHPRPGEAVQPSPAIYSELRQPPTYYWLAAAAMRTARAVGVPADPYGNPEVALRVMRFLSVLLGLGVVIIAWLAGQILAGEGGRSGRLATLLALSVALFPMRAFADGVANNDVLAELAVSALVVVVIALLRWPRGWRGLAFAASAVILAALSAGTKSSALAAAVPLVLLALPAWLWQIFGGSKVEGQRLKVSSTGFQLSAFAPLSAGLRKRRLLIAAAALAVVGVLSVGAPAVLFTPLGTAAGWKLDKRLMEMAPIVGTESAQSGRYVLAVANGSNAHQNIELTPATSGGELTLSGYARLRGAGTGSSPASAVVRLEAPGAEAGRAEIAFSDGESWTHFTTTIRVAPGVLGVTAKLFAKGSPAEFDDLSLLATGATALPRLLNPSFEEQELGLRKPLDRLLPQEATWIAQVWANPQPFDKAPLWAYYADGQYRSFWGNFGWVSAVLPDGWYAFWALASVVGLLGILARLFTNREAWDWRDRLSLVFLVTLVGAVLLGFARHTMLLSVFGVEAFPQGRYLFVLCIPIAWLFHSGLSAWSGLSCLPDLVRSRHTLSLEAGGGRQIVQRDWMEWAVASFMFWFAAFALLVVVLPYYYG